MAKDLNRREVLRLMDCVLQCQGSDWISDRIMDLIRLEEAADKRLKEHTKMSKTVIQDQQKTINQLRKELKRRSDA